MSICQTKAAALHAGQCPGTFPVAREESVRPSMRMPQPWFFRERYLHVYHHDIQPGPSTTGPALKSEVQAHQKGMALSRSQTSLKTCQPPSRPAGNGFQAGFRLGLRAFRSDLTGLQSGLYPASRAFEGSHQGRPSSPLRPASQAHRSPLKGPIQALEAGHHELSKPIHTSHLIPAQLTVDLP